MRYSAAVVTEETVVVQSRKPLTAVVDGETIMYVGDAGAYFALGDVGSRIWALIERPVAVGELCASLQERYDVDAPTCRRDVLPFVAELCDSGLAEVVS
jgi:Coenzyme PQQ synthesis protein D (PqqD)